MHISKHNFIIGTLLLLVGILVVVGCFPIKVTCGAPDNTCTSAPDKKTGQISRTYTVEPLAEYWLELITHKDFHIQYSEGRTYSDQ